MEDTVLLLLVRDELPRGAHVAGLKVPLWETRSLPCSPAYLRSLVGRCATASVSAG